MNHIRSKVITIDGLAASGKSSISKMLAERLTMLHLNSGLLYRALGYESLRDPILDRSKLLELATKLAYIRVGETGLALTIGGGHVYGEEIATAEVGQAASKIGMDGEIRKALLPAQRRVTALGDVVAEGRDMGTVVFPDAGLKFFVIGELQVRAARRCRQLGAPEGDLSRITAEISERDARDATREIAPMVAPPGSTIIDNSTGSLTEVVSNMYTLALSRFASE